MKIHALSVCLAASLLASFNGVAESEDDDRQGGQISGVENYKLTARFVATSNAPAGAGGVLRIQAHDHRGVTESEMKIRTVGLPEGTYTVTATLKSEGTNVVLGQITLAAEDEDEGNDDGGTNAVIVTEGEIDIPAEISPMDIGLVTLSDSNAVDLLVADIVNPTGRFLVVLNSRVRVTSDDANVRGLAVLNAFANSRREHGHFHMNVRGLASRTTFHVLVNGEDVGTVRSNRHGGVMVHRLHVEDYSAIHTVELQDDSAVTVAAAIF